MTRNLALSAGFLGLAAGGVAACDSTPDTVEENHRFYCTNSQGVVVPEDHCDDDGDGHGGSFFIMHSVFMPGNLQPGQPVPASAQARRFAYNDKAQRSAWGLPAQGKIGNGTSTKVGVVGKGGAPAPRGGSGGG